MQVREEEVDNSSESSTKPWFGLQRQCAERVCSVSETESRCQANRNLPLLRRDRGGIEVGKEEDSTSHDVTFDRRGSIVTERKRNLSRMTGVSLARFTEGIVADTAVLYTNNYGDE